MLNVNMNKHDTEDKCFFFFLQKIEHLKGHLAKYSESSFSIKHSKFKGAVCSSFLSRRNSKSVF